MFFRKKEKKPLERAGLLIMEAVEIAAAYKQDERYMPDRKALEDFERLRNIMWRAQNMLAHIAGCMRRRASGQPEGKPDRID